MKRNLPLMLFGLCIAALFVLLQVLFTVRQGEVVIVTQLGRPVRAAGEAGLYTRWPWPVQRLYRYDNRLRTLQGSFEETLTQDGKNVLVALYAGWRIHDPIAFLERVGTVEQAEANLDGLLRTYKNSTVGQLKFSQLVNIDPSALQLEALERDVLAAVQPQARQRYGIDVQFVGLRRLGLPEAITQSVFERMRAERQELADRYRSEGEGESIRIRAKADSERDQLLAQAEADARRSRAEGEAVAADYFQVFEKSPQLATFLRKLDALEETLREKSTVVLSSDTEPFDLLRGGAQSLPDAPASSPGRKP
jgi:membrane protease subunit HflC